MMACRVAGRGYRGREKLDPRFIGIEPSKAESPRNAHNRDYRPLILEDGSHLDGAPHASLCLDPFACLLGSQHGQVMAGDWKAS